VWYFFPLSILGLFLIAFVLDQWKRYREEIKRALKQGMIGAFSVTVAMLLLHFMIIPLFVGLRELVAGVLFADEMAIGLTILMRRLRLA